MMDELLTVASKEAARLKEAGDTNAAQTIEALIFALLKLMTPIENSPK